MGRDLIVPPRGFVSSIKRPVLNIKDRSADAIFYSDVISSGENQAQILSSEFSENTKQPLL